MIAGLLKNLKPQRKDRKNVKIVCIGETGSGKTCVIQRFSNSSFQDETYVPTVFDNYSQSVVIENQQYVVDIWDTAGVWQDYRRLRPLCYPKTEIFLVFISLIDARRTLRCACDLFLPEIEEYIKRGVPLILVGTMSDLKEKIISEKYASVSGGVSREALEFAIKHKFKGYIECSAKTGENVDFLFQQAVVTVKFPNIMKFQTNIGKKRGCVKILQDHAKSMEIKQKEILKLPYYFFEEDFPLSLLNEKMKFHLNSMFMGGFCKEQYSKKDLFDRFSMIIIGSLEDFEHSTKEKEHVIRNYLLKKCEIAFSKIKGGYFYMGQFDKCFKPHGYGIYFIRRKSNKYHAKYEGTFKNGLRDGKGISYDFYLKKNYLVYEGQFRNDNRHGCGQFIDLKNNGRVIRAIWKEGVMDENSIEGSFDCPIIPYENIKKYLKNEMILGSGAFGIIYSIDSSLIRQYFTNKKKFEDEKKVAVKIMNLMNRRQEEMVFRMTRRGIGLCSSLESDHVLSVYGLIRGNNIVGYVMEQCSNSLDKVITISHDNPRSIDEKIRILKETALGMKALHDKNIMHRDLKWGNVMITKMGVVKITDFDTLKEDQQRWRVFSVAGSSRVGTMGFLAPEVFLGKRYSLACDIFAYGLMVHCILWEMNMPFSTQYQCSGCGNLLDTIMSSNSLDWHVSNCNFRPLVTNIVRKDDDNNSKSKTTFPTFLIDLMTLCWDKDPLRRPSFSQIVEVFEGEERKEKCYSIITFKISPKNSNTSQAPNQEKMLLTKPKLDVVREWLRKKIGDFGFCNIEIVQLTDTLNGSSIESDEDLVRIIEHSERPIFIVNFDGEKIDGEKDSEVGLEMEKTKEEKNTILISVEEYNTLKRESQELERLKEMNKELIQMLKKLQSEKMSSTSVTSSSTSGPEKRNEIEGEEENEGEGE